MDTKIQTFYELKKKKRKRKNNLLLSKNATRINFKTLLLILIKQNVLYYVVENVINDVTQERYRNVINNATKIYH